MPQGWHGVKVNQAQRLCIGRNIPFQMQSSYIIGGATRHTVPLPVERERETVRNGI